MSVHVSAAYFSKILYCLKLTTHAAKFNVEIARDKGNNTQNTNIILLTIIGTLISNIFVLLVILLIFGYYN